MSNINIYIIKENERKSKNESKASNPLYKDALITFYLLLCLIIVVYIHQATYWTISNQIPLATVLSYLAQIVFLFYT